MKLPRVRIWVLMALVVVCGVGLAVPRMLADIKERRRHQAIRHFDQFFSAYAASAHIDETQPGLPWPNPPIPWSNPPKAEYHMRMGEKWLWASRYPWLPVSADPPEPD
jgi:hypothetical protein